MRGSKGQNAAIPWYLSGGIALANCIAAYQPKGAASYAASKVNLANPGTNDAIDGAATPTWAAGSGWSFLAASSQYLDGPLQSTITGAGTIIVQFAGFATGTILGAGAGGANMQIRPVGVSYSNGNTVVVAPGLAAGNLCIAGINGYRNGVPATAGLLATTNAARNMCIGATRISPTPTEFATVAIVAVAMYNVTIALPQVAALVAAMAAL